MPQRLFSQRGSALLGTVVLGVIALAVAVWYLQWATLRSKDALIENAHAQALELAESGFDETLQRIQLADSLTGLQASGPLPHGRFEADILQDSGIAAVLTVTVTGYFQLTGAAATGRPDPHASVQARILVVPPNLFAVATSGLMRVAAGTRIIGTAYGRDVWFEEGSAGVKTRIGGAVYNRACYGHEKALETAPAYVEFMPPFHAAQVVAYPVRFPTPGPTMRGLFRTRATTVVEKEAMDKSFPVSPAVAGVLAPQPTVFYDGDVDIAKAGPLQVNAPTILYVTGTATIHHSVLSQPPGFLVVFAENDIRLSAQEASLSISGLYIARGMIGATESGSTFAAGGDSDEGLRVYGSLLAGAGFDLAARWKVRTYVNAPMPEMKLPRVLQILDFRISQ